MTVAELERWAIQRKWNAHRLHWLHLYPRPFTVVPSSPDLCRKWAEVMMAAQVVGRRIECADAWIAATALLYDAPLITHNRTDYVGVPGLILVSHYGMLAIVRNQFETDRLRRLGYAMGSAPSVQARGNTSYRINTLIG